MKSIGDISRCDVLKPTKVNKIWNLIKKKLQQQAH